jgi:acetyl-CoA carboxylase biotin carboxylase subunit
VSLSRVFIANRGEIAVRIIRACRVLGLETVVAVSDADRGSLAAQLADRSVCIGPPSARDSYLDARALVAAAKGTGADALHPGYGFLAESAALARLCAEHGIAFVGPTPDQIHRMGNKLEARALARAAGLPILPGSAKVDSATEALAVADRIGLPLMMKAAAGGGGRGMKIVRERDTVETAFTAAAAEARSAFGDDTLYLEHYIANARHVEVQVLGDRFGNVIHLGERDCSLQRRHQKVIEEAPAPGLDPNLRDAIRDAAVALARLMAYESAGTVEFIVDVDAGTFFFLEMNTRIQVEHPVTEAVTGVDLVAAQLRVTAGEPLCLAQNDVALDGHAIECRITAENPFADFRPDPGRITTWTPPNGDGVRLDSHCFPGYEVPVFYDSLLAKLIVHGPDRATALDRMRAALSQFRIEGIHTTLPFLAHAMGDDAFTAGRVNTNLVAAIVAGMPPAT